MSIESESLHDAQPDQSPPLQPGVPKHVFDELLAAAARVNEHYLAQRPEIDEPSA